MKAVDALLRARHASVGLLGLTFLLFLPGCTSLPDTSPFTEATGSLRSAVASIGSATVSELSRVDIEGASAASGDLAKAWQERERTFSALTSYANSLEAIVTAGQSGAASANALADAVSQLAKTANIIQPGAGEAGSVVTQTAVFVYEWIAKARAAASLEKALAAVQPAVERVSEIMGEDLKDIDSLVRVACRAQTDALKQKNQAGLGYREQLIETHETLMGSMNRALANGRKPSELTETGELKRVEELLAEADSWYGPLEAQLEAISDRQQVARQLVAETQSALKDWAVAHGQLLAAVRVKRLPSVAELSDAAERIRELVEKFRNL